MINKIIIYIENLFENTPNNKKTIELKEEIKSNSIEKYNDLLLTGKSDEEAYKIVVESIGDINELIDVLNGQNNYEDKERKKRTKYTAFAIMLYIISVIPVIITDYFGDGDNPFGIALMFVFIGIATAILVYLAVSKPKYKKAEETMVEEFKEWQAEKSKTNAVRKSISTVLWLIITLIYLYISFIYGIWAFSWIIFVAGAAIDQIISLIFEIKKSGRE